MEVPRIEPATSWLEVKHTASWIGHTLRRNCLLHYVTEGQMTKVKGVGRSTQLLNDLRNGRKYLELNEEAAYGKMWIENKEEIQVIFHKSMDLLTGSILNNIKGER